MNYPATAVQCDGQHQNPVNLCPDQLAQHGEALMDFQNFELETFQSQFERTVEYNLADSSVKCVDVRSVSDFAAA